MNLKNTFTTFTSNRLLTTIFIFLSVTAFYSCNNNNELEDEARRQEEAYKRQLGIDTVLIQSYVASKGIPNVQRTPYQGLYYAVQTPGTGDKAEINKTVVTHYTLTNFKGDTLDTSRKARTDPSTGQKVIQPLTFLLSPNTNILTGFQQGVSLMRVGEKSKFFLSSGLAYGAQGSGNTIPPNTNLIFDIELLQVK
ncbi:FKBP-type peptidyl-prolyl cis-trans isomerase [Adhaeribacter pallidiroseus]|uniref:Peptidyl-prolyl cis-trans isomerase n=1 Tax=Adhaeribacter pallidiroseus TaxID=2072847 RepID=A0A369QK20_9BACT|nr:FKBP-type peptidyl-prolyl cis-trans isomerase [Adhaeribacter pallidiroseus]RDC65261.1 Peptidylprolyl isomerase [Adhaeribacter pallidiroseus]